MGQNCLGAPAKPPQLVRAWFEFMLISHFKFTKITTSQRFELALGGFEAYMVKMQTYLKMHMLAASCCQVTGADHFDPTCLAGLPESSNCSNSSKDFVDFVLGFQELCQAAQAKTP